MEISFKLLASGFGVAIVSFFSFNKKVWCKQLKNTTKRSLSTWLTDWWRLLHQSSGKAANEKGVSRHYTYIDVRDHLFPSTLIIISRRKSACSRSISNCMDWDIFRHRISISSTMDIWHCSCKPRASILYYMLNVCLSSQYLFKGKKIIGGYLFGPSQGASEPTQSKLLFSLLMYDILLQ